MLMAKKGKANLRKLRKLMTELRGINEELGNDIEAQEAELKGFDNFQKAKRKLNLLLEEIRQDVARLHDMKKLGPKEISARDRIELTQENDKKIKKAVEMLQGLQRSLQQERNKKKPSVSEEELDNRNKAITSLANEISQLVSKNSRTKKLTTGNTPSALVTGDTGDAGGQSRSDRRRNRRRDRRGKDKVDIEIKDEDFMEINEQDQAFMDVRDHAYEEQDEILSEISSALTEVLGISTNIKKTLLYQKGLIAEDEKKMEQVQEKLDQNNDKLQELWKESGGANTWCPRLICFLFLIALLGYVYTYFDDDGTAN